MKFRLNNRQKGFVITIELMMILTIIGIGLFYGISLVRNAIWTRILSEQTEDVYILDGNDAVLGKVIGYDEFEAPLVPYIDRNDPDDSYRVLIGIRDDRFTSRQRVFYSNNDCTGTPCIAAAGDEDTDSVGVDGTTGTGSVSYLLAMQAGPAYAVGANAGGLPGHLFRTTANVCPAGAIQSVWTSQAVVSGIPCELVAGVNPADLLEAEDVEQPANAALNAFESFVAPFGASLPQNPATIEALAPDGAEGNAGVAVTPASSNSFFFFDGTDEEGP